MTCNGSPGNMPAFQIKSRWDDKVLYTAKGAADVRVALEEAVSKGANLRGANLGGANLGDANLRGADLGDAYLRDAYLRGANLGGANLGDADLGDANLGGANLRGANLRDAYLRGANLGGANLGDANLGDANLGDAYLRGANLGGADLGDANLGDANLGGANLRGADLGDAYLRDAYLRGANLGDADLGGAKGLNPHAINDLLILRDQVGKIRAYKLVKRDGQGPYSGGITYEVGQTYEVPDANTDEQEQCGAGINLATLPWCISNHQPGYRILLVEFSAGDIAAIPIGDGKFRVSKCKVIRELDLKAIGLAGGEDA